MLLRARFVLPAGKLQSARAMLPTEELLSAGAMLPAEELLRAGKLLRKGKAQSADALLPSDKLLRVGMWRLPAERSAGEPGDDSRGAKTSATDEVATVGAQKIS